MKTLPSSMLPKTPLLKPGLLSATLLGLILLPGGARAQVVMTVAGPRATPPGGPDATFTGTITNTSVSNTYILSYGQIDGFTLDPSAGAGDVFLSDISFPTDPDAGSSLGPSPSPSHIYGPGPLFTVSVDPSAPKGLYTGTFGLYGYSTGDATVRELTMAGFTLSVTSAPEPSGLAGGLIMGAGLMGLAARRRLAASVR